VLCLSHRHSIARDDDDFFGIGHQDRRVVCFTDPAGLTAASSELETAQRLRAPVVVVVFGGAEPVRLAQGFGLPAFAADSEASFAQALGRALGRPGPALIAVVG